MRERAAMDPTHGPLDVVVAGAGVAALETAAALRALAADRVALTLIAPNREFVHRPLAGFGAFGVDVPRPAPLSALARCLDASLIAGRVRWVERAGHVIHTGAGPLSFDVLVLAVGARMGTRFRHALTIDDTASVDLRKLVADVAAGRVSRLALVAPERMAWPLPLYEVGLMTAALAAEHDREIALTLITAEATPLEAFGDRASAEMAKLLQERGIDVSPGTRCLVPARDRVAFTPPGARRARELSVDRVLALPELFGPHLRGLPSAEHGFIPVDQFCRVPGASGIYAAGDGTDFPIKHGSIAAQQAYVAAAGIAAAAGATVQPLPLRPKVIGTLLTGEMPRYLSARVTGGQVFGSRVATALAGAPAATKVAAPYLMALLAEAAC